MKTIDEWLQEAAKKGELNYFTIIPVHDKAGSFKAQYGLASTCINFQGVDRDPAKAAQLAFAESRKRRPMAEKPKVKPTDDEDDNDGSEFG